MKLRRRVAFADLDRPRVGLSEGEVSLGQHKGLRGRVLVMASGATGFSYNANRASTASTVSPMSHGGKTP